MPKAEKLTLAKIIHGKQNIGSFGQAVKKGARRKPLRTLRELADEFGIEYRSLQGMIVKAAGAPKPMFSVGGHRTSASPMNTYYDPDEVRKWYKSRTD